MNASQLDSCIFRLHDLNQLTCRVRASSSFCDLRCSVRLLALSSSNCSSLIRESRCSMSLFTWVRRSNFEFRDCNLKLINTLQTPSLIRYCLLLNSGESFSNESTNAWFIIQHHVLPGGDHGQGTINKFLKGFLETTK